MQGFFQRGYLDKNKCSAHSSMEGGSCAGTLGRGRALLRMCCRTWASRKDAGHRLAGRDAGRDAGNML